ADACGNHLVQPERIVEEDQRIIEDPDRFDAEFVMTARKRIELYAVVRAYIDAKRRAGRIDFNDQVIEAVAILDRFDEVRASVRERFPALLLDEYQDTNIAQRRLLQLMAPMGHNVTAVGDARQNIFQWRGSTLFNLIDFPTKHFLREGGQAHEYLSLARNYRSGSSILAVANHIIDSVPVERRPGEPLVAQASNGTGAVVAKVCGDQYSEARFIASEIASWRGRSTDEGREPLRWNDFAILVRRRAHIGPIYQTLREHDIPVEVVGLTGLLQVPEVLDVVSWLRVLADPGPNSNRWLARILMGPRFRIHYRDLALLSRWAAEHNVALSKDKRGQTPDPDLFLVDETQLEPDEVAYSLTEALDHLDEVAELPTQAHRRLERARAEVACLRPLLGGSLLEVVQTVIASCGVIENLDASPRDDVASTKANITNFMGFVAGFAPISGEPSMNGFLAYLDAAEDVEETLELATPATGDSVKLMTVHQAKGLEFEVVFVPCVAAGTSTQGEYVYSFMPDTRISNPMTSFGQLPPTVREDAVHLPDPWTVAKDGSVVAKKKTVFKSELVSRAIEDERRLFYVALTRAKQRLYVTAAWWYERQSSLRGPSLFFNEVAAAPDVTRLADDECPTSNPLHELLLARAVWPP
ncbi:MAG: ATP-dependent helicase, partial [Actinomycetota bacterium]